MNALHCPERINAQSGSALTISFWVFRRRGANSMRQRQPKMPGSAYKVVAEGIRRLPDEIKTQVADHFARYFHERAPSFDPQAWYEATGGLVNRKQAA
jgi:hypothetical protein